MDIKSNFFEGFWTQDFTRPWVGHRSKQARRHATVDFSYLLLHIYFIFFSHSFGPRGRRPLDTRRTLSLSRVRNTAVNVEFERGDVEWGCGGGGVEIMNFLRTLTAVTHLTGINKTRRALIISTQGHIKCATCTHRVPLYGRPRVITLRVGETLFSLSFRESFRRSFRFVLYFRFCFFVFRCFVSNEKQRFSTISLEKKPQRVMLNFPANTLSVT